jgi:Zn-dependent membrane protease YugP
MGSQFIYVAYAGIICFALSTIFQLLTLPTEFNASKRALASIKNSELLYGRDIDAAKKVLSAAAMTYVAALAVSVMQLLHLISIVGGRRR